MHTNCQDFRLEDESIEVVREYEFLNVLLNYTGRFWKEELALKEQATRALYPIIGTSREYDSPLDTEIELFNTMAVAVFTYGCEVCGESIIRQKELLHMKFFKHVLYVHRRSCTDLVCRDLGVLPRCEYQMCGG